MATYTIFAGVNGIGKTSIYKSIYYERNKNEKRINTDEMVARVGSFFHCPQVLPETPINLAASSIFKSLFFYS